MLGRVSVGLSYSLRLFSFFFFFFFFLLLLLVLGGSVFRI